MDLQIRFPEVFTQTNIDRRGCQRNVEMKIIAIGMMRTGTMSMMKAFNELGYQHVYHMIEVMKNPPDADMWKEASDAKFHGIGKKWGKAEWDAMLGECDACIDVPTAAFMPELIAAYPDAKVIICMRDPNAWMKSVNDSVGVAMNSLSLKVLAHFDSYYLKRHFAMIDSMIYGLFGKNFLRDHDHTKEVYLELHEEVRQMVPKDRLLEFQLKQGWAPLCDFLGKDIPEKPFPHVNESAEFGTRMALLGQKAIVRVSKQYLPMVGATAALAGVWYLTKVRR